MKITKKQAEIVEFIENFISNTGYSPTYREIQAGLGYKSVATVAKHIDNLVAIGRLEKAENGEARSVEIRNNKLSQIDADEKFVLDFLVKRKGEFEHYGDRETSKKIDEVISKIWPQ